MRASTTFTAAVCGLVIAAALALPAAASAGTRPLHAHGVGSIPKSPTAACSVFTPGCLEPVAAISGDPSQAFNPESDTGMTYTGPNRLLGQNGGAVSASLQNDLQNGRQDFTFVLVAFVPYFGSETTIYGLTQFDMFQYGGLPIAEVEYTPFGIDTGKCLTENNTTRKLVLEPCASNKRQVSIIDPYAVPGLPQPGADGYVYVLNVQQAPDLQHHRLMTAPSSGNGQLTEQRGVNHGPGQPSGQQWSAIGA